MSGEVGQGRTLVFAANVAAANEVATVLADVGLQPLLYHREVSPQDRAGALDAMRAGYFPENPRKSRRYCLAPTAHLICDTW